MRCARCRGLYKLEPFNIDGKVGVPACLDCRNQVKRNSVAVSEE